MALLIKSEGLKDSVGNEIHVDNNNQNSGVLVRFENKAIFKGLDQNYTLAYYVGLAKDLEGWGSTNIYYPTPIMDEQGQPTGETNYTPLITSFTVNIPNFETIIYTYDMLAQQMQGQHPCIIFAYGYHYYVKQELEKYLGADTVVIRLDLM